MPWTCSGSVSVCADRRRGLSEENGSWKTICIRRRSAVSAAPRGAQHVLAVEADVAAVGLDQAQHGAGGGGLAAAALADEPEGLARLDGEGRRRRRRGPWW